jgi:CheY-like chemotaxis protein
MRLLIVDDEPHIRQMMRLTLEPAGYQVDEASNGEAGLARFGDGHDYAAVLLDQKMPGIDGLETLREIRKRAPGAPVLIVTAFASVELAVDAMKLGATDFLRKPMTPEALRSAVAAAAERQSASPSSPSSPRAAGAAVDPAPRVLTVTLNGFQILPGLGPSERGGGTHSFRVKHFPDGVVSTVVVTIDPEIVARVERLTRRTLPAGGSFWHGQAERLLAAYLWSEGKAPSQTELWVRDVSRDDIERLAAGDLGPDN